MQDEKRTPRGRRRDEFLTLVFQLDWQGLLALRGLLLSKKRGRIFNPVDPLVLGKRDETARRDKG